MKRLLMLLSALALAAGVNVIVQTVQLAPGQSAVIACVNALAVTPGANSVEVDCAANTATPTLAPTVTSAPTGTQPALAAVDPAILGTCTAAIHDRYTVVGPDGHLYRTWHPQVVLIDPNNPSLGTCTFAHEHGDDPSTSIANPHMPAYGYIASQAGLAEPHQGFKTFVANAGSTNNDGYTASNSTVITFHQGTDGAGRFDTEFHSLIFDLVAADGHYVHVQGLADTGGVGNICANPRQGRTVMELPSSGCALSSAYEIWAMNLNVGNKVTVNVAVSVFDPITVLDQTSLPGQHPLIYTSAAYPQFGTNDHGCNRESYSGPIYWYNASGPTAFTTDAYGHLGGSLAQQVSANSDLGIRMASGNFYQMKHQSNSCAAGLGLKN